jgi:hypothetical protein
MHSVVLLSAHDLKSTDFYLSFGGSHCADGIEELYAQTSIDVGEHRNFP